MLRTTMSAVMTVVTTAALAAGLAGSAARAQDQPAPAAKEAAPKKPRGRLPNYYGRFVSQQQREQIYSIQARYREMIDKLRRELEALEEQRDTEVRDVLTEEQQRQVDALVEQARARRRGGAKPAKPAEPKTSG